MGKQSDHTRCGHNKEIFMLNVKTLKKSCFAKLFKFASIEGTINNKLVNQRKRHCVSGETNSASLISSPSSHPP